MRAVQVWRTLRLSAGLLAAAVIVASGATVRAQEAGAAAPAGDATKGKEVFFSYYCSSCHGSDGQGGAGVKLAPGMKAFNAFRAYVRKPTGNMPPYISKLMSDGELADVYAYLKTVPPGQAAKDIALLNP